jgi:SAM-dependent methyltransferase
MDYGPETYGDRIADIYDELYDALFDNEGAVEFLAELATEKRALELGIGTGRVAIPLSARGVEVHGIDASQAMVDKLRAKPGGKDLPVYMGDFAEVDAPGDFDLIYIPFNTLFGLLSQEDQVRCFRNAAAHLTAGGAFVIEAFVPDLTRFDQHQRVSVESIQDDEVQLEVTQHDPVKQSSRSYALFLSERGTRMYPVRIRYAWPSELDLMARLAGLELRDRFGSWRKEPFTSDSKGHISVYARPA